MNLSIAMIAFFFLLQLSFTMATTPLIDVDHVDDDIIAATCNKCAVLDAKLNYTLCITSLSSIPRAHHSDLRGLALVATDIALAMASDLRRSVRQRSSATPPDDSTNYMRSCFKTCLEVYSDAVDGLRDSKEAIAARRYGDADVMLTPVVDAPGTCEDSFGEGGLTSPLTVENGDLFDRTVIALAIVTLLNQQ